MGAGLRSKGFHQIVREVQSRIGDVETVWVAHKHTSSLEYATFQPNVRGVRDLAAPPRTYPSERFQRIRKIFNLDRFWGAKGFCA